MKTKLKVDTEYLVTDQCFWQQMTPKEQQEYNPYDPKRAPHAITLVDPKNGTLINLPSGSIIKVVKVNTDND
jgi:hypothetical protein